ncbi:MAG: HYR domain-containing protein, partial [Saprospirales bacterium]|nr:HYR domain-containing protein [Saprospirales bacterium]
ASGFCFPVGVTTNTFVVTAANSQTASCSFTVTVSDNEPPAISCPSNVSVNNDPGQCCAVVNYTAPVGTDNCPGPNDSSDRRAGQRLLLPGGSDDQHFRGDCCE